MEGLSLLGVLNFVVGALEDNGELAKFRVIRVTELFRVGVGGSTSFPPLCVEGYALFGVVLIVRIIIRAIAVTVSIPPGEFKSFSGELIVLYVHIVIRKRLRTHGAFAAVGVVTHGVIRVYSRPAVHPEIYYRSGKPRRRIVNHHIL